MPRKILHRISRIFNHKENITAIPAEPHTPVSIAYQNNSVPVLLQRAPSSKLLIDDYLDVSTLDYSYSCNNIHEESYKQHNNNRQTWFTSISKLKTLKKPNNKKRKSDECWFVTQPQQQQGDVEIPDQQRQQGVSSSPLSVTSSLYSINNHIHPLSSSSSSWLPIEGEDNLSTARTSIDSQAIKNNYVLVVQQPQLKQASCISLAENVKHILGDAIYLADQELDI